MTISLGPTFLIPTITTILEGIHEVSSHNTCGAITSFYTTDKELVVKALISIGKGDKTYISLIPGCLTTDDTFKLASKLESQYGKYLDIKI